MLPFVGTKYIPIIGQMSSILEMRGCGISQCAACVRPSTIAVVVVVAIRLQPTTTISSPCRNVLFVAISIAIFIVFIVPPVSILILSARFRIFFKVRLPRI